MIPQFAERLERCMEVGQLNYTDIGVWFGRSAAAPRKWVRGATPLGVYAQELAKRLQKLEIAIEARDGESLIPYTVSTRERKKYLLQLLDH